MSYHPKQTTLIARQGYAGLGAMDRGAAASYCGQKYGVTSSDFQPCVDWYASGKSGEYSPPSSSGGSGSGVLTKIGDFAGGLLKGILGGSSSGAQQPMVVAQSSTPDWVMPVAIGGIGLVAIMLLKQKRSNPARRRRRRR